MNVRALSTLVAVGTALAPLLASSAASAQGAADVRFRGGIGLDGGAVVLTTGDNGSAAAGAVGLQGQLGVQITSNWAVYAAQSDDVFIGGGSVGLNAGIAILAEYTFSGAPISIGVGPLAGISFAGGEGAFAGAWFVGGKLHTAFYPFMSHGAGGRRHALYLGLDLGLQAMDGSALLLAPTASIGYQAF